MFNDNNPNILKQKAIFGEASYKITPTLKLTAGMRFYKFDISNMANQRGLGTASGDATPTIDSASGTNTSLLPKVNLSYEPTPDLTLYSTLSKGSRPGGVNLPIPLVPFSQGAFYYCGPGTGPSYLNSQPSYYAPDNIWSLEFGEKSRFDDRRFTVNADVFYVKWHNIQQLIVLSCGYPYNTNVGDAKTYGPELEMAAKLTDALTVDMTAAYTQAYISAAKDTPGLPITDGTRVTSIPKYTGNVALSYETDADRGLQIHGPAGGILRRPGVRHRLLRRDLGIVRPHGLQAGLRQEPLGHVRVRHQPHQQACRADHRQYGVRLAAADHHPRLDQSAAHHRPWIRDEVLTSAPRASNRPSHRFHRGAKAPRFS